MAEAAHTRQYELLREFRAGLHAAGRTADEDVILDLMDRLVGFVSPADRLSSPGQAVAVEAAACGCVQLTPTYPVFRATLHLPGCALYASPPGGA